VGARTKEGAMRNLSAATVGLAAALAFAGCGTEKAHPPVPPPTAVSSSHVDEGRVEHHRLVTATVAVVSVDHDKRELTLRGPQGNTSTLEVGDEVKNFDQIRKGDHVVVRYYEAVAVQLHTASKAEPGATVRSGAATAAPGAKPAAVGVHTITVTAKIT